MATHGKQTRTRARCSSRQQHYDSMMHLVQSLQGSRHTFGRPVVLCFSPPTEGVSCIRLPGHHLAALGSTRFADDWAPPARPGHRASSTGASSVPRLPVLMPPPVGQEESRKAEAELSKRLLSKRTSCYFPPKCKSIDVPKTNKKGGWKR